MSEIIKVENVTKRFGEITAVDNVSFQVNAAEVFGFLGQNGAGKSTTIRMLLSLVQPSSGNIEVFGMDLKTQRQKILQQVGAIIERPDLYNYLSGYENVSLFGRISGMRLSREKKMEQLDLVGLKERAHSKVKTYSQGMKQRLGLAVALIHDPQLIILDEPTNGLDPQGIADVRNLILHLSKHRGKTDFVSSHLLSEIEMIADRMVILDKGRKIVEGRVKELFNPERMMVELAVTQPAIVFQLLQESAWAASITAKRDNIIVLQLHQQQIPDLAKYLVEAGAGIVSLQSRHSLETYFLSLTTENRHVDAFTN